MDFFDIGFSSTIGSKNTERVNFGASFLTGAVATMIARASKLERRFIGAEQQFLRKFEVLENNIVEVSRNQRRLGSGDNLHRVLGEVNEPCPHRPRELRELLLGVLALTHHSGGSCLGASLQG